jgi:hypothetical protein
MTNDELEERRTELREIYVQSSPKQRLNVALLRLKNPSHEPNLLVIRVSAVEALARSLLVHKLAESPSDVLGIYEKYKFAAAPSLVKEYLSLVSNETVETIIGLETWQFFEQAVHYRNLLIHECTYLGQDKTPYLIDACRLVLLKLAEISGLPSHEI